MNKKLRKLIRNPKQFFADAKPLQPLWRALAKTAPRVVSAGSEASLNRAAPIEVAGMELFELVGNNWLEEPRKPVAVLWGFHPWKRSIVSRYLNEYRTAYVRGRTGWAKLRPALDKLATFDLVIWGMTDQEEVRQYAFQRSLRVLRMEDGFLRSVDLGSSHSTALSLVLDDEGIYFDARKPSRLERILCEQDFSKIPNEMEAASALIKIIRALKVSKYNGGSLLRADQVLGPRIKRRILVIGQVEEDASIHYGLAEGWTNQRLIELARQENPGCEILYKPHPDVLQGFRGNSTTAEALKPICRVITEDLVLADLFGQIDHVYTLTSLSGFEALLMGVKVTTIGAPFYSGWGLTDDRTPVQRRTRVLTLDELFCAAYLLYPRYLADLSDTVRGCLATVARLTAQQRRALDGQVNAALAQKRPNIILESEYWPAALRQDIYAILEAKYNKKLNSALPMQRVFSGCHGDHFQRSMAYWIVGKLQGSRAFAKILHELKVCIRPAHFSALLKDLWDCKPSALVLDLWASCCEQDGDSAEAKRAYEHLAYRGEYNGDSKSGLPIAASRYAYALKLAQFELRHRRLESAYALFNQLLLSGYANGDVITGVAEIARLRFDFDSSAALLRCFNRYDPAWKQGRAHLLEAQAAALAGDMFGTLSAASVACATNPQTVESVGSFTDVLDRNLCELPYADAWLAANELTDEVSVIGHAKALIASHRAADAEAVLLAYTPAAAEIERYCLALSGAYSYQGKLLEAKKLISSMLSRQPSLLLYREGLRLSVAGNDYVWGQKLLNEAVAREMEVGDIYHRKIALGLGDIERSYVSFREIKAHKILKAYLAERYVQSAKDLREAGNKKILITAFFGPGDEIRFASLYSEMRALSGSDDVTFTCDPRLHELLRRSYPDIKFKPSGRIRSLAWLSDFSTFNELPGSDLHVFYDNEGWASAKAADRVTLTTDLLGDLLKGYESFRGGSYLKPAEYKASSWRERLAAISRGAPVIGLSWRSSLTTYSRNEHYLSVQDLEPLFELQGVQFVNLQYDNCGPELQYLQSRYPGRIVDFEDLDQYNDLDSVAALLSCLDLVIAPATTVVELAGALGCPTLLLSNSSELHWRKRPGTQKDVWHNSVTHIEAAKLGDKKTLAEAARDFVRQRFARAVESAENAASEVKRQVAA